jgi:hypothetical protein
MLKLKPVYTVGEWWPLIPQPDGALELVTDAQAVGPKIKTFQSELKAHLEPEAEVLDPCVLRNLDDIATAKEALVEADVILLHILGLMPLGDLLQIDLPIIAFSGDCTPMMGLYTFPTEERERHSNLAFCLDYQEIKKRIQLLDIIKQLRNTSIAFVGDLTGLGAHRKHLPDEKAIQDKFGIKMHVLPAVDFASEVARIDSGKADSVAKKWIQKAAAVTEPSNEEITQVATIYLAIKRVLQETDSQAVAVGCLELMYLQSLVPHCFALAALRDEGTRKTLPLQCLRARLR